MSDGALIGYVGPHIALTDQADLETDLLPIYLLRFDRDHTRRAYANDLRQFFGTEAISLTLARRVDFRHVNEHLADLEAAGAKPATLQRRVAAIRGFYSWLVALQLMAHNPADRQLIRKVRRERAKDRLVTVLTRDQAQRLIEGISGDSQTAIRDRALLLTLLHCVLRRSEAAAMEFSHLQPSGPYWVLHLPRAKGGSNQFVKVPEHVANAISDMGSHYGFAEGPIWRSLSNNSYGKRLSDRAIYAVVSKAAKKAGLDQVVGAHTLRHTGCTLAIEAGATLLQVQTHARHRNIETTMIYVHQRDRLKQSAADYIAIDPGKTERLF
jgi:site-specific recombinase XerD